MKQLEQDKEYWLPGHRGQVTAQPRAHGWWELITVHMPRKDFPEHLWTAWAVAPDGRIYEGHVTGSGAETHAEGSLTDMHVDQLSDTYSSNR